MLEGNLLPRVHIEDVNRIEGEVGDVVVGGRDESELAYQLRGALDDVFFVFRLSILLDVEGNDVAEPANDELTGPRLIEDKRTNREAHIYAIQKEITLIGLASASD